MEVERYKQNLERERIEAQIAATRAQGLADFKVPNQFVFVDHFVETAALKLSRKALRAHLRAQLDEKA